MPLLAEKVIPSLAQMVAAGLDDKFGSGLLLMVRFKNTVLSHPFDEVSTCVAVSVSYTHLTLPTIAGV